MPEDAGTTAKSTGYLPSGKSDQATNAIGIAPKITSIPNAKKPALASQDDALAPVTAAREVSSWVSGLGVEALTLRAESAGRGCIE